MRDERRGETMKLGAFFHPTGNHVAAWRHPEAQIDAGTNFRHYAQITQTAERSKFDLMFVADAVAVRDGNLSALSRWPQYMAYFDPLTLLPALAAVTQHIGLVATATTSYNEPYHIARKFASLDHIRGGRAGWNVVTSSARACGPHRSRKSIAHATTSRPVPPGCVAHRLESVTLEQTESKKNHCPAHIPLDFAAKASIAHLLLIGSLPYTRTRTQSEAWPRSATDSAQTTNNFHNILQNRLALLGKESVSVGHRRHPLSGKSGDPTDAYLYHWQ